MNAFYNVSVHSISPEVGELISNFELHRVDAQNGFIAAKTPWQTLFWGVFRIVLGGVFLFLAGVFGMYYREENFLYFAGGFGVCGTYLLWRGVMKIRVWRRCDTRFILLTSECFFERKERVATRIPWNEVKSVRVIGADSEKGRADPSVVMTTSRGEYAISAASPLNPIAGTSHGGAWYGIFPFMMLFSPQPAYYADGALAIKNKIEAFLDARVNKR